jgi:hypothetical protein
MTGWVSPMVLPQVVQVPLAQWPCQSMVMFRSTLPIYGNYNSNNTLAQAVYAPNTSIMMKADKNLNKSVK